ncbi:MAG TPA: hypothetical protein VFP26_13880 [Gemmatimonadaceae bacterium]|nr:hypothetical protein [Gemmatimonadaceae bacterium]
MVKRVLLSLATSTMLLALPTAVGAQTTGDDIIHACYIPLVGVVYRIKAPGLPAACLGKSHVEFQWNSQGIKGDRGDPGPAGNLGLSGQNCPVGYFVSGFSSVGALVCRNTSGNEPPIEPPPPTPAPSSALNGTWLISPTLVSSCTAGGLSGYINVTGLSTSVNSGNQLTLVPTGTVSFLSQSFPVSYGSVSVAVTDPLTFPITMMLRESSPVSAGPVSGVVEVSVSGSISSLGSFSAQITVNNLDNLQITLPNVGTVPLVCTQIRGNVTGSRIS